MANWKACGSPPFALLSILLFALAFDLYALLFGFSEIYLLSTVFYCAFPQIKPRKVQGTSRFLSQGGHFEVKEGHPEFLQIT